MNTHADKTPEHKSQAAARDVFQKKSSEESVAGLDNRPQAIAQRKLQETADNSPQARQFKAMQDMADGSPRTTQLKAIHDTANGVAQAKGVVQLLLDDNEMAQWVTEDPSEWSWMTPAEKEQMGRYKENRDKERQRAADWVEALATRVRGKSCVSWDFGGKNYHINLSLGEYHVTEEASPKIHYFFSGFGAELTDKTSGNGGKNDKVFSALPTEVQLFVKGNFAALLL